MEVSRHLNQQEEHEQDLMNNMSYTPQPGDNFVSVVEQSIYNTPAINEIKTDNFVTYELGNFAGSEEHKNSFFAHLIDMYTQSATNKACIDSISDHVYGKGLAIKNGEGEPILKGNGNSKMGKLNNILDAKDLKRLIKDRILFGQAAVQITYSGVGRRKKIQKLTHFPIQTLAFEKMSMGKVKAVYYHPDWSKYEKRDKLKRIPLFGMSEDPKSETEIAICKPYVPGYWYFALPQYAGGLDYALLESRISEFLINDIDNGFSGTTIMNINRNIKDPDKRDYMVASVKEKLSGVNGDKTVIFFNENPNQSTTLERFPLSDAPSHYDYLAQESARKILTAHRITNPKLLAIPTPGEGGLGNNANEIQTAAEMLQNLVIEPLQIEVVDFLMELLDNNNFKEELMFVPLEIISEERYQQGYYEQQQLEAEDTVDQGGQDNKKEDDSTKEAV